MEPVFTIQYAEYKVANFFKEKIKGCSVFIPSSAQEKGIDLLLYKNVNNRNRVVTVQVKMSRTYQSSKPRDFVNNLWFNRYNVPDNADWNVLVGIYPMTIVNKNGGIRNSWEAIMLAFTKDEMKKFMTSLKQKKDATKDDSKFGFGFNVENQIFQTRGCQNNVDVSKYLIINRLTEIESNLL